MQIRLFPEDYAMKPMHFSGYPGQNSSLKSWIYSTSIISPVSHFHLFQLQNCIFSTLIFMRKNGRNHYKFSGPEKRFIISSSTYVICDKVFKSGLGKFCGGRPLKNFTCFIHTSITKL